MSLESPLLSRVVRLLSFGTGDPRLPTFPLARSVPGQSGDTRPFAIVLQETLARIDSGSGGLLGENSSRDCTYFNGVSSDIL